MPRNIEEFYNSGNHSGPIWPLEILRIFFTNVREATKKSVFSGSTTKTGGGGKGPTTKEKELFFICLYIIAQNSYDH